MITFTSFPKHAGKTIAFFFFEKKAIWKTQNSLESVFTSPPWRYKIILNLHNLHRRKCII